MHLLKMTLIFCVWRRASWPFLQSLMLARERESYLQELEAANTKLVEAQNSSFAQNEWPQLDECQWCYP